MKYSWTGPNRAGMRSRMDHSGEELLRRELTKNMDMNRLQSCSTKRGKRYRSAFTTDQINYLETQFKKFPYIGNGHRKEVAITLNIPERAVKIWFQNRRMKEKKDAIGKEFEEQQNGRKTGVFVKDQLNNVSTLPNDNHLFSLPMLTNSDTGYTNVKRKANIETCNASLSHSEKQNYYEETLSKDQTITSNMDQRQTQPAVNVNKSPEYKSSAEFSIGLCKKYKTEATATNFECVKLENKPEVKQQPQSNIQFNNVYVKAVQDSPEDLSSWKKSSLQTPSESLLGTVSSNNAGYLPVIPSFYAQPYISSGNMIWKPINVMPIMSTAGPAVTVTNNQPASLPLAQGQNVIRKNCNCNCHAAAPVPQLPVSFQGPGNPQYIITALPFQNPAPKF